MIGHILKTQEEFQNLKSMIIQDGQINGLKIVFDDENDEPMEYPCLAKTFEIDVQEVNFFLEEDQDLEEALEENEMKIQNVKIYDFDFTYQSEIRKLLDA